MLFVICQKACRLLFSGSFVSLVTVALVGCSCRCVLIVLESAVVEGFSADRIEDLDRNTCKLFHYLTVERPKLFSYTQVKPVFKSGYKRITTVHILKTVSLTAAA